MNQYTYSNCFELINNNNNISDYLFDSSFSNQPINNESDCADYAYYNNHPSFFFQNGNNNDISKCFVINYDKINNNDPDKNKKTAFNTISNLNYDFKNNINLPRYNLKEIYNEDGTYGYQPLDQNKCSSSSNPYKKSFKYFLLKSFSNNYDLDYNKLNKRLNHIKYSLLREYDIANTVYDNAIDPNKKQFFKNNFLVYNPYFKNLYPNKNTVNSNIYNDIVTVFINNTFKYVSTNFFGICISNNLNSNYMYNHIYQNNDAINFYSLNNGKKFIISTSHNLNQDLFYDDVKDENNENYWLTTPGYTNSNKYFRNDFLVSTKYLGLPLSLFKRAWSVDDLSAFTQNKMIFTPKNYDKFELIFQDYVHISFFSFLIEILEMKLKVIFNYETTNYSNNFISHILTLSSTSFITAIDNTMNNEIVAFNGSSQTNGITIDSADILSHLNQNINGGYWFSYYDILYCLYRNKDDAKTYIYKLNSANTEQEKITLQNDVVEKVLIDLLIFNRKYPYPTSGAGGAAGPTVPEDPIPNMESLLWHIKTYMKPQITLYLTPLAEGENYTNKYNNNPNPNYNNPPKNMQTYEMYFDTSTMTPNLIKLIKNIYFGEFRLKHTGTFFDDRIKILNEENNLIMNDINNMRTYIDNIYLHSKLNNIEDYIFNEKSKLNYLFNKNSSAKQKNDDLNFLNNFTLIENVILCIIIFILILFFIKK